MWVAPWWLAAAQLMNHPSRSLSAWLGAFEHPVVDKINQRIEDITGLDVTTAEDLQVTHLVTPSLLSAADTQVMRKTWCQFRGQRSNRTHRTKVLTSMTSSHSVCICVQVANYGVGGQYEPHFDFGRVSRTTRDTYTHTSAILSVQISGMRINLIVHICRLLF